ncbi:MAG: large-conductance mechanosensitive channel protein MscL [Oligoflexia bacterium]|nr:large-conductance mechanosensitive channel protein MscL [Oligoflexia bacterium]MBF0364219.1 large-conductance mechanosensitive channel protein MscL [Oligoflexia bacterium]
MWQEFKDFITRGNVLDLAVGIIIGAAFGRIVTSLVNDILMPPIGLILGKVDFSNLYWNLSGGNYESLKKAQEAGAVTINYGLFINTVIDFLIVAAAIFFVVRWINQLRARTQLQVTPKQDAPAIQKECPRCFNAISIKATRCPYCTSDCIG